MDIIDELRSKSQLFSLKSQLGQTPANLTLQKSIQDLEDSIVRKLDNKSSCAYIENCKPGNTINTLLFKKAWNRLRKDVQADRLYVYCQHLDLTAVQKSALFGVFKQDLENKVLTKKGAVKYNVDTQEIVAVKDIDVYLNSVT